MGYFVKKDQHGNRGFILPSGTTAERPTAPIAATLRYNTSTDRIEYYNAALSAFVDLTITGDVISVIDETATIAATLAYDMMSITETDPNNIIVFVQGVYQTPTVSYSVSGTTVTFVDQPPVGSGETIVVVHGAFGTNVPTQ